MKNILLVYLPFCTPATPPYSITHLYSFLKNNCNENIEALDLNLEFHKLRFPEFQKYYQKKDWQDYDAKTHEYQKITEKAYSENNKRVVDGKKPELFDELLKKIKGKKPDIIAFSIVYSSQAFYAYSLLKELKELKGIKTVIGGPAVNSILIPLADKSLNNELELLEYITGKKIEHKKLNFNFTEDFSSYSLKEYFSPMPVIPIKTSSTCYYKRCTYCSHFSAMPYCEYDLSLIKKTIVDSKQKYFFMIDDMIPVKRLLDIAKLVAPLDIRWTCQLRPTKDLDLKTLEILRKSGLTMIMWGIESGNDRILSLINKGTNVKDIGEVISNSKKAGIKNVAYIIFGFPGETKEEFVQTIDFLKKNEKNIDLVSSSVFGLQKGTVIYNNPEKFKISKITETKRTVLEPKIDYEVEDGLTQKDAAKLRKSYKKTIEKINKYPARMNFFREHMLILI